ncbi:CPK3 [Symbiodinium sp. CCMP2456]|nr:CPK3 [Symbiodinium sp. CCMP2456]
MSLHRPLPSLSPLSAVKGCCGKTVTGKAFYFVAWLEQHARHLRPSSCVDASLQESQAYLKSLAALGIWLQVVRALSGSCEMTVSRSRSRTPRVRGPRKAQLEAYAWHFDMIHDEARLSAFHGAFSRLPDKALQGVALDIGCGTGVLGMCLLRQRPELSRVIAFEADPALARVAEANAANNRLEGKLSVQALRSTAVSSLADVVDTGEATSPPRASLLVAEILDAGLLGEDCLPFLLAMPEMQIRMMLYWGGLWMQERCEVITATASHAGWLDAVVFWWYCHMVRADSLPTMTNAPTGVAMKTRADSMPARPEIGHWRQAVSVLPGPRRFLQEGEELRLSVFHTDEDVWFRIAEHVAKPMSLPRAYSNLSFFPSSRLWALADRERWHKLKREAFKAARGLQPQPLQEHAGILVLDLSDGPFMSLLLSGQLSIRFARLGGLRPRSQRLRRLLRIAGRKPTILSFESSETGLGAALDVLKSGRGRLWKPRFCQIQPLICSPSLAPESVHMICGEPYATECEGMACDAHFWQHWAQVDALRWTLAPGAVLMPRGFRVRAALLSCAGLWQRRQPVTAEVCGVDVSRINKLHPSWTRASQNAENAYHRFACSLWQVEHRVVSEALTLCEVDFAANFPKMLRCQKVTLHAFRGASAVHGVVTWTECDLRGNHNWSQWLPTARLSDSAFPQIQPTPFLQGVVLARQPQAPQKTGLKVAVAACFRAADGALNLQPSLADGEVKAICLWAGLHLQCHPGTIQGVNGVGDFTRPVVYTGAPVFTRHPDQVRESLWNSIRGILDAWFAKDGGGAYAKRSKKQRRKGVQLAGKKSGAEGPGFGIHCFIINNSGDIDDFYQVHEEVNAGGSAQVFRAVELATKAVRAVKRIAKKSAGEIARVIQEVAIMKTLDHPNIVKLFETFEDDDYLYLVLEYCAGGDVLDNLLSNGIMDELAAAMVMRGMLSALNYLNANGYVHRDLKPENIMYKENAVKEAEVPWSTPREADRAESLVSTIPVLASHECPVLKHRIVPLGFLDYALRMGQEECEGGDRVYAVAFSVIGVADDVDVGFAMFEQKHSRLQSQQMETPLDFRAAQLRSCPIVSLLPVSMKVELDKRLSVTEALDHPWLKHKFRGKVIHLRDETVERLVSFSQYHDLRRAAMLAVAFHMDAEDLHQLRELFRGLDLNGDGLLTTQEFSTGVRSLGVDAELLDEMIRCLDADHSGVIDYTEFLAESPASCYICV